MTKEGASIFKKTEQTIIYFSVHCSFHHNFWHKIQNYRICKQAGKCYLKLKEKVDISKWTDKLDDGIGRQGI